MEHSRTDLAWLAGLYEGEGSCSTRVGTSKRYGTPMGSCSLSLGMTDEDVVRRAREIFGFGKVYREPRQRHGHKDMFVYSVSRFEFVQAAIAMVWPWLGQRRRAQALECLRTAPGPRWRPGARRTTSEKTRARARELMQARWDKSTPEQRHDWAVSANRVRRERTAASGTHE